METRFLLKRAIASGIFVFSCLFSLLTSPSEVNAKRFASDVPKEAQIKMLELENIVGISVYTGIISKSYTDYMIDRLLDALDSQYIDVKMRSLDLLIEIIKQINIPNVVIEKK